MNSLTNKLRFLPIAFEPLIVALNPFITIPFHIRWRLIPLQLLNCIAIPLKVLPYAFTNRYKIFWIPTRTGGTVRALVFTTPPQDGLRPLHIDFHGGAFVSGIAEINAWFCETISERTGAVVISSEYRHAPRYIYPAAHEDAEDVIDYCLANAEKFWNADPETLTVSGSSAGGNLMFVAGKRAKAAIGISPVLEFRKKPGEKRVPEGMPRSWVMDWLLMPLFDTYAGPGREKTRRDGRLNPSLKEKEELPENLVFIVAGKDILFDEEMEFVRRVRREFEEEEEGKRRRCESLVFEKGFHGWLEVPKGIIDENDRRQAWNAVVDFVIDAQKRM